MTGSETNAVSATLGGPCVAVILAGGTGSRFGSAIPKQLAPLAGEPVMHHTLRKFDRSRVIDRVVVASNVTWHTTIEEICKGALRRVPYELVDGGDDRNNSVEAALRALASYEEARVLIHDAVRPLVSLQLISSISEMLNDERSVIPVIPSVDPVVITENGLAAQFLPRSTVLRGQSPQGFRLSDLRRTFLGPTPAPYYSTVYEAVSANDPTIQIRTVPGDLNNLKITTPVDHMIAGRLLLEEE